MIDTAEMLKVFNRYRGNSIVVPGRGGRHWVNISDKPNRDLPLGDPAMGGHASFAMGLALAQPGEKIVLFDSDGDIQMAMGILATIAEQQPKNFYHFMLDNDATPPPAGSRSLTPRRSPTTTSLAPAAIPRLRLRQPRDFLHQRRAHPGRARARVHLAESPSRDREPTDRQPHQVAQALASAGGGGLEEGAGNRNLGMNRLQVHLKSGLFPHPSALVSDPGPIRCIESGVRRLEGAQAPSAIPGSPLIPRGGRISDLGCWARAWLDAAARAGRPRLQRGAAAGVQAHHFIMLQGWFFLPGVGLYGLLTGTLELAASMLWGMAAGLFVFIALYNFARAEERVR